MMAMPEKWRLSRPCYDKPHRCPGWAGGGWKYARRDLCHGGSIRTRGMDIGYEDGRPVVYGEYPGEDVWRFGHCTDCNVRTWPFALRRLDPTYWRALIQSQILRLRWKWEDRNA